MSGSAQVEGSPLVLLVNDEEWTARSLDTVLRPNGYAVLLAYTGQQGLDLAAKVRADCILVDYGLPDMTGADLVERIRSMATVRESTPILVVSTRSLPRPTRLECFEAGAWDVLKLPFDTDEFLIRIDRYVGAKRDADVALEQGHVDPLTGLYNVQGLTRRVTEILADAARHDHPLACLALSLTGTSAESDPVKATRMLEDAVREGARGAAGDEPRASSVESIAKALAGVTRVSDIVARVGNDDFVIVAPSTDEEGAQRLADRLFETLEAHRTQSGVPGIDTTNLRAGYHAMNHPKPGDILPEDLLTRATLALRQAQAEESGERIRAFDFSEPN